MWLALASGVWQAEKCPSAHLSCPDLCFGCALCLQEVASGVRLGEPEDASQRGASCPPSGSSLPAVGRELGCHVPRPPLQEHKMQDLGKLKRAVKSLSLGAVLQHQTE